MVERGPSAATIERFADTSWPGADTEPRRIPLATSGVELRPGPGMDERVAQLIDHYGFRRPPVEGTLFASTYRSD